MTQAFPPSAAPARPSSGMAIASLVLGILGFCVFPLGIVGLILGILALRARRGQGGGGLALAGTILSAAGTIMGLITAVLVAILLPALGAARQTAMAMKAQSEMRQIEIGLHMYISDHGGYLPPGDQWQAQVAPYIGSQREPFPLENGKPARSIALNAQIAGKDLSKVGDTSQLVMIFEARPGSPPAGGAELLPQKPFHRGFLIGFADGSVQSVPPETAPLILRWSPEDGQTSPSPGPSESVPPGAADEDEE